MCVCVLSCVRGKQGTMTEWCRYVTHWHTSGFFFCCGLGIGAGVGTAVVVGGRVAVGVEDWTCKVGEVGHATTVSLGHSSLGLVINMFIGQPKTVALVYRPPVHRYKSSS